MKKIIIAACLSMLVMAQVQAKDAAVAAADTEPTKELTPQQQKMKNCNADAKSKALKGDERKAFMKACLSAK